MRQTITIDWGMLYNISYRTQLGKSLRNTLRKFNKEELFNELSEMILYFTETLENVEDSLKDNRIKSIQSCFLKYNKYCSSKEVEKVFNDILGFRIIIDEYTILEKIEFPENTRIVDMSKGKKQDDGYRGIHVYFQKDHFHYPIEIQFVTKRDRMFNEWLHIYLYKYTNDNIIGVELRSIYETGKIRTEDDFRKEMKRLCAIL